MVPSSWLDVVGLSVMVSCSVMEGLLEGPQAGVEPAGHFVDVFGEVLEDLRKAHASLEKRGRAEGEKSTRNVGKGGRAEGAGVKR